MYALKEKAENFATQFYEGLLTVKKSQRKLSAIAITIDYAHEQNNATVKGDGGAAGLTENPSVLRRWTVSGPDVARVVVELEESMTVIKEGESL